MSLVREDDRGLYIWLNGGKYRPGGVTGWDHAYDMDDGGLKKGDKVRASVVPESPLTRIRLESHRKLMWHRDDGFDRSRLQGK